jgi:hypothetical protein
MKAPKTVKACNTQISRMKKKVKNLEKRKVMLKKKKVVKKKTVKRKTTKKKTTKKRRK